MYEEQISALLKNGGAAKVGFCRLQSAPLAEFSAELGELVYAVSFAYPLSGAVIKTIDKRPSIMYFQHYRAVNARLDSLALDAVRFIERKGFSAFPIAASQSLNTKEYRGVFPHKTAAVLSGLGFVGKSSLLITPEYGSAVRLATVITDMPLDCGAIQVTPVCGECRVCADACPAHAISGDLPTDGCRTVIDSARCSAQMKTYSDIGRGAVCGICMRVCPLSGGYAKKEDAAE